MYAAELPDPFPNSEVKRGRADDSLVHASAKVGSCPFIKKPSQKGGFFIFDNMPKTVIIKTLNDTYMSELSREFVEQNTYMAEALADVNDESISSWIRADNLESRESRNFAGFEIINSIDGGSESNREVSLVKVNATGVYPPHVHKESDAYFIVVSGETTLLLNKESKTIKAGDKIEIPRGVAHGFDLKDGEELTFISIQSPPIRNPETGEEDLHLSDLV